jgi:lysophospholipase L1-like esterase
MPQLAYLNSIRNIHLECIDLVDRAYIYKAYPGECKLNNIEYSTILNHDSEGFRNIDTLSKRSIVFLGDSHTHGFGVNDNQTFAKIIQDLSGLKSVNLGMISYATKTELEALKAYTNNESIIVIQYCDNDVGENKDSINFSDEKFHARKTEGWKNMANSYFLGKKEGLLKPIREISVRLKNFDFISKNAFYESAINRDINSEAKNFANIISNYKPLLKNKKIFIFESSGFGNNHPGFKAAFEENLARINLELDITVLDSTSFLTRSDYYFLDDHLNAKGHHKIAHKLSALLSN